MPIEAGAVGVRPALRPQAPGGVDGVTRREDEGSAEGFRPQTNVAIENAIDDMAGVLSKIATSENEALSGMPQDLQKVLQNVLKNAFSFDETLAEGLGSAMESQRFSMEQLSSMARTLTQMAALAEKGYDVGISDELQTLLKDLKDHITASDGGKALEPVLILKESFELLNGKDLEELPQVLKQMIAQMQIGNLTMQAPSESMSSFSALKQLIQYFMPQGASSGEKVQASEQWSETLKGQNDYPSTGNGSVALRQAPSGKDSTQMTNSFEKMSGNYQTQNRSDEKGAMPLQETRESSASKTQMTQGELAKDSRGLADLSKNATGKEISQTGEQPARGFPAEKRQGISMAPSGAEEFAGKEVSAELSQNKTLPSENQKSGRERPLSQNEFEHNPGRITENHLEEQAGKTFTAREAKELLMQQPFENSERLMNALKNAARELLREGNVAPSESQMLQNFIKDGGQLLHPKEARQLETLLRLCQQNIPATVQQAVVQRNLPELSRLWAFLQLCDLTATRRMGVRQLKKAGREVSDFVASMRSSMEGEHAIQQGQRSMNFMMPLYLGTNEKSYPAYIHVYDEHSSDGKNGAFKKETWMRVCILTEYLGAVELTCRVYEREHLDLRLFFMRNDAAQQFRTFVPELRRKMRGSKLHLEDISIDAAAE